MIGEKFIVQAILQPATTTAKFGKTSLYISYNSDPELFEQTNFLGINPGDTLYLQSNGGHAIFSNLKMKVVGGIPPDLSIKAGPYWHTNDIILPIGLYWPLGVQVNVSNVPFSSSVDDVILYKFPDGQKKEFSLQNPPLWDYKGQYNNIPDAGQREFYKSYMLSTYAIDINNIPEWTLPSDEPVKIEPAPEPELTFVWNATTQAVEPVKTIEPILSTKPEIVEPIQPIKEVFTEVKKVALEEIDTVLNPVQPKIEIPELPKDTDESYEVYNEHENISVQPKSEVTQALPVTAVVSRKANYNWLKYAAVALIGIIIIKKLLR